MGALQGVLVPVGMDVVDDIGKRSVENRILYKISLWLQMGETRARRVDEKGGASISPSRSSHLQLL